MQVALKATQKQLSACAADASGAARAHELEGALKQAVNDYQVLLAEMAKLRRSLNKRERLASDLQKQLQTAQDEAAHAGCASPRDA